MPQIIDQFGSKRYQKKRKDVYYKLLSDFFQKYFVIQEQSAVKNTLLCPGRFILVESVHWPSLKFFKNSMTKSTWVPVYSNARSEFRFQTGND